MPIIKIFLGKGKDKLFLKDLKRESIGSVMNLFKIPSDKLMVVIMEYEKEFFEMKDLYKILIEISTFPGRTTETKRLFFSAMVEKLSEKLNINRKSIIFVLMSNLLIIGDLMGEISCKYDFGFK